MPNRIEREIEEILTRLDEFVPNEPRSRRARRRAGSTLESVVGQVRGRTKGISGGHVVLGAAVLLLLSFVLGSFLPHTLIRWMTITGLVVIFGAIILSIRPIHRRGSGSNYWRGQVVEMRRPGPITRLKMWWRRNRRR